MNNTGAGYVVSSNAYGVENLTFDRTVAETNGQEGYLVYGSAGGLPARLLDIESSGNGGAGVRLFQSAHIENAYVSANGLEGILVDREAGDASLATVSVVNSTIKFNRQTSTGGSGEVASVRARTRLAMGNTIIASNAGSAASLVYDKRYSCVNGSDPGGACSSDGDCLGGGTCTGEGGEFTWDYDLIHRASSADRVSRRDREGAFLSCNDGQITTCDINGDCDASGGVHINEMITAVAIALGNANLAACSEADANGNRGIGINELIGAVANASNSPRGHNLATQPIFAGDGMHLTTSSPGANAGGTPGAIVGVGACDGDAGNCVCRANDCDFLRAQPRGASLQLYLAAAALGCGLFAQWYRPRARFAGDTLLAYLFLQAASTFLLEALRAPFVPSVRWGSFVIALCAGAWWLGRCLVPPLPQHAAAPRAA